jgi:NADPH:quinone reductase-like Zn-dependent oxidoreductase
MKAVVLYQYGGPEQLRYEDAPTPDIGDDEVLVRVRATSVNPIDYKIRSGSARSRFPLELPAILGRDLCGEVIDFGRNAAGFAKGMRVMALANRTYAESAAVKADVLAAIPGALSFEQAAALPLVVLTGAQLIERGVKPCPGQTVLVTGALGSVGRSAVHVAKKHGVRVLAGVRAAEREKAAELSADGVVAIDDDDEVSNLRDLDAVADTVGGATAQRLMKAIRTNGMFASVLGVPLGAGKYNIHVEPIMAVSDGARLSELAEDLARGEFAIPIARRMPLAEIQEAHRIAETNGVGGKIVLVP